MAGGGRAAGRRLEVMHLFGAPRDPENLEMASSSTVGCKERSPGLGGGAREACARCTTASSSSATTGA